MRSLARALSSSRRAPPMQAVEAVLGDGVEQRHGLQPVAGAVETRDRRRARVDRRPARTPTTRRSPSSADAPVAELEHLGEVVAGVDVDDGERERPGPERLLGQAQQHDGVLAAGEQQRRALELAGDLAQHVDGVGLERRQLGAVGGARSRVSGGRRGHGAGAVGVPGVKSCGIGVRARVARWVWASHRCRPHSVLVLPAQRPARASSPSATARVQGQQPTEG